MKVKFLNGPLAVAALALAVPTGNASLFAQAATRSFSANDLPELVVMGDVDPALRKAQAIVNGDVITDFASISKVKMRAVPSGIGSVYFDVSHRVIQGFVPSSRRRSHFTLLFPSKPGSSKRIG